MNGEMAGADYYNIGKLVYGAQRLDFALTSWTAWMGEEIGGENLSGAGEISAAYFRGNETYLTCGKNFSDVPKRSPSC